MMPSTATPPHPPFGDPLPAGRGESLGGRDGMTSYSTDCGLAPKLPPPSWGRIEVGGDRGRGHRARPIPWKIQTDRPPTFILHHKGGGDQKPSRHTVTRLERPGSGMSIKQVRLSSQAQEQLIRLKTRTGIQHWNVLCRWAFCLSLRQDTPPVGLEVTADSNVEMTWQVFGGDAHEIYLALLKELRARRAGNIRRSPGPPVSVAPASRDRLPGRVADDSVDWGFDWDGY